MLHMIWTYLFIGTIVGLLLETMVRMSYNSVNMYERFWLITLWPLMLMIFMYYFLKHLFFNIDDE
jgi:uncharacterized protein YacL